MTATPPHDPLIGARLGANEIERQLGAGGMSAVYLARQERPRRLVAIKVVSPHMAPDRGRWPLFLARFRREADAMAALDHANIVPIYDFGEQGDMAYLVMPYFPDGSLSELLAREGRLPVKRAVAYIEQVALALDYAHQHGIVHRDVKPSNVLLHPDGRVLLADFGIARPLEQADLPLATTGDALGGNGALTMAGDALGTPDYMSPEQIRGLPVGPAADIYALGALTYTLLAGYSPFGGPDMQQTLTRQLHEPPQPLRLERPDVSRRVEEAIFWALAKDPSERPSTAGELGRALQSGAGGASRGGGELWRRAATLGASLSSYGGESGGNNTPDLGAASGPAPHDAATVWDPRFSAANIPPASGGPSWPGAGRGPQPPKRRRPGLPAPLIAVISAALVMLVVMGVVVGGALAKNAGSFAGGILGAAATATLSPTATATATPSPTPSPSPSPTPPTTWLTVDNTTLTLRCKKPQDIHLTNIGPRSVKWTTSGSSASGVTINPSSGTLHSNTTVTIRVNDEGPGINRQGDIVFSPTNGVGGDPVVVSFSAAFCL